MYPYRDLHVSVSVYCTVGTSYIIQPCLASPTCSLLLTLATTCMYLTSF